MSTSVSHTELIQLLQELIAIPSFSGEEQGTADRLAHFLIGRKLPVQRLANNVFLRNLHFDPLKPSILLNSHHDTVKPNKGYTRSAFDPAIENGQLFGLGSNDAGASLVCLLGAFLHFYSEAHLPFNLVWLGSAEEEISGKNGVELVLGNESFQAYTFQHFLKNHSFDRSFAIVGEPTQMQLAVAERGLMVIDAVASGIAGHAARAEGENALIKALEDIQQLRLLQFPRHSNLLGATTLNVTVMNTRNQQHNVIPDHCHFVLDVRVNEQYTFDEILDQLKAVCKCELIPRSMRLRSTCIDLQHPAVQAGIRLGKSTYGSPTTSDKALMFFPSLKMGPGDSARSHTADEFIHLEEIEQGLQGYIGHLNETFKIIRESNG